MLYLEHDHRPSHPQKDTYSFLCFLRLVHFLWFHTLRLDNAIWRQRSLSILLRMKFASFPVEMSVPNFPVPLSQLFKAVGYWQRLVYAYSSIIQSNMFGNPRSGGVLFRQLSIRQGHQLIPHTPQAHVYDISVCHIHHPSVEKSRPAFLGSI